MKNTTLILLIAIAMASCARKDTVTPTATPPSKQKTGNSGSTGTTTTPSSGGTIQRSYNGTAPIFLRNQSNITISGDSITAGYGPAINLDNCSNIHITKSKFINGNSVSAVGINIKNCTSIIIDSCLFLSVSSGVFAVNSTGISIINNQMRNMMGPYPRGQFVQFDHVYGAENAISKNRFENILGQSDPEDAISLYACNGMSDSPITVTGNWIRGGGPSNTGGGIMLGDEGGSYESAGNNILVNPGQYGISISSGTNMVLMNNQVYASQNTFTNVGVIVWNQYNSGCAMNTVTGNQINYTSSFGRPNPYYAPGNCGEITGWDSNTWYASITAGILPETIITYK